MKAGWRSTPVGKVCTVIAGQSPEGQFYNAESDGLPFFQGKKDFQEKHIGEARVWTSKITKEAQRGDILMSVRAPVGPINFAIQRCCIGRGLAAIRAGKEIEADYLYYILLFKEPQISGNEGAVFASINKSEIEKIEVPLPPLDEQRRIVAVLDKAFAGIATATANAQKNLTNARALFESELDAEILQVQAQFDGKPLSDACERITVGHVGPMKTRYFASGIPFLRSQNVRPFKLALDNVLYIDEAFDAELKKSRLQAGDVAVVRTGYPGTAAVVPKSLSAANCADLVIIRPSPALNPHYLAAILNSNTGKISVAGKLNGAAQKHFNVGAAKKMKVAIPSLVEQCRIVDRIELIDQKSQALADVCESKLAALTELKQSLLKQAFAGELT